MKIIVDENIPCAYELFSLLGNVKTFSGRTVPIAELEGADALMVRSVTKVNEKLLSGKSIRFVGTATSGFDHIDTIWLQQAGINFVIASGCNSISVVEYIFSALLELAERDNFILKNRTVGIVGVGHIGGYLQQCLNVLGVRTVLCDPPRADRGENNFFILDELIEQVDIITFHTPLYKSGPYKTLHLVNKSLIRRLKPGTILINTCRGSVIDNNALLECLESGQKLSVVLDVWESEPDINVALLNRVNLGTAHIAGHTIEGKLRGTIKLFEAYSAFIGKSQHITLKDLLPTSHFLKVRIHGKLDQPVLKNLVHTIYDIHYDDILLRKSASIPGEFDRLRKYYTERREWSSLYIQCDNFITMQLLQKLGFNAIYNAIL